jgi:serine/threonine-protein kinase
MNQTKISAAFVFGVFLALLACGAARAEVCTTTCSAYNQGECVEHTQTCTNPTPPPPNYGAIAYGRKSGAWGESYGWDSEGKAEGVAMGDCAEHGKDCEVMVWFRNECGAVASAKGDKAYWGIGDGEGAARGNALANCKKDGASDCEIEASQCSR